MSESLDRIFPPEECLSEELLATAEQLGIGLLWFFRTYGARDEVINAPTHLEDTFGCHFSDLPVMRINFEALWKYEVELAELRLKLNGG